MYCLLEWLILRQVIWLTGSTGKAIIFCGLPQREKAFSGVRILRARYIESAIKQAR